MTRRRSSFALLIPLFFFGLLAGPGYPAPYGTGREIQFDECDKTIDKRIELMNKKLDLSPDQQFNVKTALNEEMTRLDLLKKEVQEAKQKIISDTDGKMMGILTPQQQEPYRKIKSDIVGKIETTPADGAVQSGRTNP